MTPDLRAHRRDELIADMALVLSPQIAAGRCEEGLRAALRAHGFDADAVAALYSDALAAARAALTLDSEKEADE